MSTSTHEHAPGPMPRLVLGALLTFGALHAFAGGYYGVSGAEGLPREWLEDSPFTDYLIPSLFLFVVVGGSLLFAAIAIFTRRRIARLAALAAAVIVLVWIAVQVSVIGYVSWMQPAACAGGLLILGLARNLTTCRQPSSPNNVGRGKP